MTRKIVLIDGGMGQELLARSSNKTPRMWSADYLVSEPDLVRDIHSHYIRAGATVLTINAYSATYTRMARINEEDRVPELQRIACALAIGARDAAGAKGADVAIAGCLSPLNGSYRADRVRDYHLNLDEYRKLVAHQAPFVDLFICETMSSVIEAQAAVTAGMESGKPVWLGCTVVDNGGTALRSGERIADVAGMLGDQNLKPQALLANCSAPESLTAAMPELAKTGFVFGGYANGFTSIPADYLPGRTLETLSARRDLGPDAYAAFAMQWVEQGASIVGGCCEVGPAHIARLCERLVDGGYELAVPADIMGQFD